MGNRSSLLWKKAVSLMCFSEVGELCLGYTNNGTKGLGSGKAVAELVADALWEAVENGVKELKHFEEVGLLREGIGADRISDATAWLIRSRLAAYTQQVCVRHNIPTRMQNYPKGQYKSERKMWEPLHVYLPVNPCTKKSILLVPRRYLRDLPTISADGFWDYCRSNENETLRNNFSFDISSNVDKKTIIEFAKSHPEIRAEYIASTEHSSSTPYDFEKDKYGYVQWYRVTASYCKEHTLRLSIDSTDDFQKAIQSFLEEYKNYIENNKGWSLLWNEDGTPKREEAAQLLFLGIVKQYCRANDIDISREPNIGRGPVDFKVSKGYQFRALLELKLAKNTKFWNGVTKQLPQYQKAEGVNIGYFIVVLYSNNDLKRLKTIKAVVDKVKQETGYRMEALVVDARRDPLSASKL